MRRQRVHLGNAGILTVVALLWAATADAGELYRWVDQRGNIHYTDAPPPESARSARPDGDGERERGAGEREAREREQAATDRAERSRQDRILQRSYGSVADLERTRDRRLEGVEGEIGLAEHRVEQARDQVQRYDQLLENLPADNEHRPEMERQREEALDRLERRRHELGRLRAKRSRMEERFARDIERFRELIADSQ